MPRDTCLARIVQHVVVYVVQLCVQVLGWLAGSLGTLRTVLRSSETHTELCSPGRVLATLQLPSGAARRKPAHKRNLPHWPLALPRSVDALRIPTPTVYWERD